MLAVIKTGGKQYKVSPGDKIKIEKLEIEVGKDIVFNEVLLIENKEDVKIGTPFIEGASVVGKILEQGKDKKVIIFKYKPKTRYRKKTGHRQLFTEVEIEKINV